MNFPDRNPPIPLADTLVDLAEYRINERIAGGRPDPLIVHTAYAQDHQVYRNGQIVSADKATYERYKTEHPNELVNKFSQAYATGTPLLLHKKLADVLVDAAIDMRDRHGQFTVVMDALRTYDSGRYMERQRPDLVEAKLLAPAGKSAHNRALAVDSKLFELTDPGILDSEGRLSAAAASKGVVGGRIPLSLLREADEKGHLDDLDMKAAHRFHPIPKDEPAYKNRLNRLQAWQRAAVKNKLPVANLLAEFWDDRVPGSPADMWRVLSVRALAMEMDGNPATNPVVGVLKTNLATLEEAHAQGGLSRDEYAQNAAIMLNIAWEQMFSMRDQRRMEEVLGPGAGRPPVAADFIFHEWLQTIHDRDLIAAGFAAQARETSLQIKAGGVYVSPRIGRTLH